MFSRDDVAELITAAAAHGLCPVGDIDFTAAQPTIRYAGLEYTFAWLALEKDNGSA